MKLQETSQALRVESNSVVRSIGLSLLPLRNSMVETSGELVRAVSALSCKDRVPWGYNLAACTFPYTSVLRGAVAGSEVEVREACAVAAGCEVEGNGEVGLLVAAREDKGRLGGTPNLRAVRRRCGLGHTV